MDMAKKSYRDILRHFHGTRYISPFFFCIAVLQSRISQYQNHHQKMDMLEVDQRKTYNRTRS